MVKLIHFLHFESKRLTIFMCNAMEVLRFHSVSNGSKCEHGNGVVGVLSGVVNREILISRRLQRGRLLVEIFS